jgi:hypothetical protein
MRKRGYRVRRDLQVSSDGGVGKGRPDALPQHFDEKTDGSNLMNPAEFEDVLPYQIRIILPVIRIDCPLGLVS